MIYIVAHVSDVAHGPLFKIIPLTNHEVRKAVTSVEASTGSEDLSIYQTMER